MHEEAERLTMLEWARTKAKWFLGTMALVMIGALFLGLQTGQVQCGSAAAPGTPAADGPTVVATVGGDEILYKDWYQQYTRFTDNYKNQNPPGTLMDPLLDFQMQAQGISALISSRILEQQALQHGITPDPEKVEEQYRLAQSQLLEPMAVKADRSILQKVGDTLTERKRERQFTTVLASITGLTPREFRKQLELQVIQEKYQEILRKEAEESVKADALKQANDLKAQAEGGEDFVALAKEHSKDTATKDIGGRVDELTMASAAQKYGDEFVAALRATEPGKVSAPIYSELTKGYYLVKLDIFRRASGPEFEAEKDAIRQRLMDSKKAAAGEDTSPVNVTEDEIENEYELASFWQIFIPLENTDQAFQDKFNELLDTAQVEITEPELEAGYLWMVREDVPGAVNAIKAALDKVKADTQKDLADNGVADAAVEADPESDEAVLRESILLSGDLRLSELHYVAGSLIASQPDKIENERLQKFFAESQSLDAFTGFPEPTPEEKAEAEAQRKEALGHFDQSLALNPQSPFAPMEIARMATRLELKERYPQVMDQIIEGLEYASRDLALNQKAQQLLNTIKGAFDPATQTDLIARADEELAKIATRITEIQKAQEEFKQKQQAEIDAMLGKTTEEPEVDAAAEAEAAGKLSGADAPATQSVTMEESGAEDGAAEAPAEGAEAAPAEGSPEPPPADTPAEGEGETPPAAGGE
ncbi:MAG TPA: SurA N-terminal domain-containing protein [bacterium]|nr:SurA N-terminal domain-containing protein [bacterium]